MLPPSSCSSSRAPAALQTSQEPLTLASITDSKTSTGISVIGATLFIPEATSTPSSRPYAPTAASTSEVASASLSGRIGTVVTLEVSTASTSSDRSVSSAGALPPARVSLAPAAASPRLAALPRAPVAPVMRTDWPATLNRSRGLTVVRVDSVTEALPVCGTFLLRYGMKLGSQPDRCQESG